MASEEASSHNQLDEERPSYESILENTYHVMVEYLDIRPILFKTKNIGDSGSFGIHIDRTKLMNRSSDIERKQYVLEHAKSLGYLGIEWLMSYLRDSNQTPLWHFLTGVYNGDMAQPNSELLEQIIQHKVMREKNGSLWYETVFQCAWYVLVECLDAEPITTGMMTEGLTETDILSINSIKLQNEGRVTCLLNILESREERGLEWLMQYLQKTNQDALRDYLAKIKNGDLIYPDDQRLEYLKAQTKARMTNVTANEDERDPLDEELHKLVLDSAFTTIKDHLVPQDVLDEFKMNGFLQYSDIRDIEELENTTEKNRRIVQRVREKGKDGYDLFKECLTKTKQNLLRTYLEKKRTTTTQI